MLFVATAAAAAAVARSEPLAMVTAARSMLGAATQQSLNHRLAALAQLAGLRRTSAYVATPDRRRSANSLPSTATLLIPSYNMT